MAATKFYGRLDECGFTHDRVFVPCRCCLFRVGGILAGGLCLLEALNQGKILKRQQFGKLWKKLVADGPFSIYILNGLK